MSSSPLLSFSATSSRLTSIDALPLSNSLTVFCGKFGCVETISATRRGNSKVIASRLPRNGLVSFPSMWSEPTSRLNVAAIVASKAAAVPLIPSPVARSSTRCAPLDVTTSSIGSETARDSLTANRGAVNFSSNASAPRLPEPLSASFSTSTVSGCQAARAAAKLNSIGCWSKVPFTDPARSRTP